jgi:hypothetical protein
MRSTGYSPGSGGRRSRPRKTKPIYPRPQFYGDMDINSVYPILINLSWILAMVGVALGVIYVFVKPEEKQ